MSCQAFAVAQPGATGVLAAILSALAAVAGADELTPFYHSNQHPLVQIFGLPGMGSFALRGILSRDLPVIQAVTLVYAVVHVGANLLVDLSYGLLNPKVRVS